jgi:hypothetical protein
LRATLASYCGHFRHAHARRLVQSLLGRRPWLRLLFDSLPGPRLAPRWEPRGIASLGGQWRALRRRFRPARLLIQVGWRWELHGGDHAGLPPRLLRGARPVARPGLSGRGGASGGWSCHPQAVSALETHWRAQHQPYALVAEEGRLRGGLKRRTLRRLFWTGPLSLAGQQAASGTPRLRSLSAVFQNRSGV